MTNLETFYFIGKCLTMDEHPGFREETIRRIKGGLIDWERFVALGSSHLVLPAIYLKFREQQLIGDLPEELAGYLKEIFELNRARNTQIMKQLSEVTKILNRGNIFPTFLKGSGFLLDGLYSDPGERMIGDIDFLVREKDYLLAAGLLKQSGYSMVGEFFGTDVNDMKHYPRIAKPDGTDAPAALEIHRLPVSEAYESWFGPGMIDKEKKEVPTFPGCFVLSDKHNTMLNFIHSQLGHEGHTYGIVSFRDLYDLYLLSKRYRVEQALPEMKAENKAIAYFVFAGKAFGFPGRFCRQGNFSSWYFTLKHDLNLSSSIFYHIHRTVIYLVKRIVVGFTLQVIKSFYSAKMRRSLLRRLGNRQWYREHFRSYLRFFGGGR
ncbi:nucleotidyltransferase family protein [Gaoshiqia sp. Z1-71]|uniref:nucleotidyltransferase family protein n=1 Tax=Gaoshiqia hydrogeniformans TaxID=3290090 RepID=UPI003BF8503A